MYRYTGAACSAVSPDPDDEDHLKPPALFVPGFFQASDPAPQLVIAPSTGAASGYVYVLATSGRCKRQAHSGLDLWTDLAITDANNDGLHEVMMVSYNEVSALT